MPSWGGRHGQVLLACEDLPASDRATSGHSFLIVASSSPPFRPPFNGDEFISYQPPLPATPPQSALFTLLRRPSGCFSCLSRMVIKLIIPHETWSYCKPTCLVSCIAACIAGVDLPIRYTCFVVVNSITSPSQCLYYPLFSTFRAYVASPSLAHRTG